MGLIQQVRNGQASKSHQVYRIMTFFGRLGNMVTRGGNLPRVQDQDLFWKARERSYKMGVGSQLRTIYHENQ